MRRRWPVAVLSLVLALAPGTAVAAEDESSDNLAHVKNLPYEPRNGGTPNFGTDLEFGRVAGREYAFAGSYRNGMQIVDITDPRQARIAAVYDCGITQGDVQVFRRDDHPGRTFVTYTSDTFGDGTSTCYREAEALGFDVRKPDGQGRNGTFIADVTDPLNPRTVSFVEVAKGSHNQTVHPSGRFLYNSNSDLATSIEPAIEVFDIGDLTAPRLAATIDLPVRPGLGSESHDITFNSAGTRAYSAALSQGVIIDTEDPGNPRAITSFLDPAINVWHQADPFTLTDADGNRREFLIVEDEVAGAVGTAQCPTGGVHVYEITGAKERNPEKVGYWNIDDAGPTHSPTDSCTAHVFRVHEREKIMTIAYYNGGVRVVDISGLEGISLGESRLTGAGMKEIAFYRTADANSWSAKTPRIHPRTGDFYLYGNDIRRGLDVYRFEGEGRPSQSPGRWRTPEQARAQAAARPKVATTATNTLYCLLPQP
jgi:hypothetical protein